MKAHFVRFLSPGTFVAEETRRPIESWDVDDAKRMADDVTERYGATPYGFQFITRERSDADLDSKQVAQSGLYYLGGMVETLEDLERRNDPEEATLRSNMRCNGWSKVVTNTNSWRWTQPLRDGDVVLDYTPPARLASTSGHVANDFHVPGRQSTETQHLGDEGTEVGGGAAPEARP